jgi:hypothetical protein
MCLATKEKWIEYILLTGKWSGLAGKRDTPVYFRFCPQKKSKHPLPLGLHACVWEYGLPAIYDWVQVIHAVAGEMA